MALIVSGSQTVESAGHSLDFNATLYSNKNVNTKDDEHRTDGKTIKPSMTTHTKAVADRIVRFCAQLTGCVFFHNMEGFVIRLKQGNYLM